MSEAPSILPAVVLGQTTGEAVGPAEPMSYMLRVQFPWGPEVVEGVKPVIERWTLTNVRAIAPNTVVPVGLVNNHLQLIAREMPDAKPCEPPGGVRRSPVSHIRELIATVRAMDWSEKSELRRALDL